MRNIYRKLETSVSLAVIPSNWILRSTSPSGRKLVIRKFGWSISFVVICSAVDDHRSFVCNSLLSFESPSFNNCLLFTDHTLWLLTIEMSFFVWSAAKRGTHAHKSKIANTVNNMLVFIRKCIFECCFSPFCFFLFFFFSMLLIFVDCMVRVLFWIIWLTWKSVANLVKLFIGKLLFF